MTENISIDRALEIINQSILDLNFNNEPKSLFEPISYMLSLGGKRVRPALVLLSYNLYKDNVEFTIPAALGVEVFHNFTLLHDDLMDRADLRRGGKSVHIKWNDNTAILSGDAMLIESYKQIGKIESKYLSECLNIFSTFATGICCGQQLDMEFEKRNDVSIDEYLNMIKLKTAVLLGGALEIGAVLSGAPDEDCKNLYDFGVNIGMAFQLMDDILDVYGDSKTFGKKIGGDILCNKKTFLLLSALNDTNVRDELTDWLGRADYNENDKISSVTNIYNKANVKSLAEKLQDDYYQKAIASLNKVNVSNERKKVLMQLAKMLKNRNT